VNIDKIDGLWWTCFEHPNKSQDLARECVVMQWLKSNRFSSQTKAEIQAYPEFQAKPKQTSKHIQSFKPSQSRNPSI
jgi:hypothetical protein